MPWLCLLFAVTCCDRSFFMRYPIKLSWVSPSTFPCQDLYTGPQAPAAFEWVSGKYADWKAIGKWEYPVVQCACSIRWGSQYKTTSCFAEHRHMSDSFGWTLGPPPYYKQIIFVARNVELYLPRCACEHVWHTISTSRYYNSTNRYKKILGKSVASNLYDSFGNYTHQYRWYVSAVHSRYLARQVRVQDKTYHLHRVPGPVDPAKHVVQTVQAIMLRCSTMI